MLKKIFFFCEVIRCSFLPLQGTSLEPLRFSGLQSVMDLQVEANKTLVQLENVTI
jgi:hypothetical protein